MVHALTDLMLATNNTGFLDYYASMFGPVARNDDIIRKVQVLAPPGIGAARFSQGAT